MRTAAETRFVYDARGHGLTGDGATDDQPGGRLNLRFYPDSGRYLGL